jgi:hypothetical protein
LGNYQSQQFETHETLTARAANDRVMNNNSGEMQFYTERNLGSAAEPDRLNPSES